MSAKLYGIFTCPQCGELRKYFDKQKLCYQCRWWAKHHNGETRNAPLRIRDGFCMKHGLAYSSYRSMKKRCLDENYPRFYDYGGRGIKICDRWLGPNGFRNFVEDLGDRPNKTYSLGRIDNESDYCPENCRWETANQQATNKRNNLLIPGVSYSTASHMWRAYYQKNNIAKSKLFASKDDAIRQRKLWENELQQ